MIPQRLTISGIYSYRERVEIDFTKLIDASIFGIFGKVGEGKSTILEAMTYSIYREAERLNAKENRGYNMMNLNSDEMLIDFEFKAGNPAAQYKATLYARRNSKKRQEIKPPEWSAYKKNNNQWEPIDHQTLPEILGLSHTNFRRAIIIPQGKFQEFLHLKPAERTHMLKELFNLEQYDLLSKTKIIENANKSELDRHKGALSQLDSVSTSALAETNAALKDSEKQRSKLQKEIEKLQKTIAQQETRRENFEILTAAKKAHQELEENRPRYQSLEKEIAKAETAITKFAAPFELYLQTQQKEAELSEQVETYKKEQKSIAQQLQQAEKRAAKANADYEKNRDRTLLIQDLKTLAQIQELAAQERKQEEELIQLSSTSGRLEKLLQELQKKEQKVKIELKQIKEQRPDPLLLDELTEWFHGRRRLHGAIDERKERSGEIDQKLFLYSQRLNENPQIEKTLELHPHWKTLLEGRTPNTSQISQKLQEEVDRIQIAIQQKIAEQENLRLDGIIQRLADDLTEGRPCPICGSPDHPHPAHGSSLTEAPPDTPPDTPPAAPHAAPHAAPEAAQKPSRPSNQKISAEEIQEELENLQLTAANLEGAQTELALHEARTGELLNNLKKTQEEVIDLEEKLEKHQAAYTWTNICKPHDKDLADAKKKELETQNRLRQIETTLEQLQAEIAEIGADKEKARTRLDQAARQKEGRRRQMELLESQLQTLAPKGFPEKSPQGGPEGGPEEGPEIKTQIADLEKQIAAAEKEKSQAESQTEAAARQKSKLEGALGEAQSAHKKTVEQRKHTEEKLRARLKDSPFRNLSQVEKILSDFSEQDIETKKEELKKYNNDRLIVGRQIKEYTLKTKGQPFDQAKHEAASISLEQKSAAEKEIAENLGALKEKAADLKRKIEEKQKLESALETAQARAENIAVLKNLFSGSGFVKYISSVYLQNLCDLANERFHPLTRRQYKLELNEYNEFIVRDYLNGGMHRLAKTLSGGESFQASLCLALALSESIHTKLGAAQSLFFLDEGFGSLDQSSLQAVFDTLRYLQKENRIVGVISHVEELRQNIDVYLEVKKSPDGSSRIAYGWEK